MIFYRVLWIYLTRSTGKEKVPIKIIESIIDVLLKRNEKQLSTLKEFADYYIEDFQEIKDLLL